LAFVQRFIPRLLAGLLSGYIYLGVKKLTNATVASFVTGFSAALLNTVLFMFALIVLFGSSDYLQGLMGGRNVIMFVCTFVGVNAVVEMLASTAAVGLIGRILNKFVTLRR
jgi:uncharacterized membrane protein